ncbi:M20 family metallopeptidase [Alsobacter sp. SYSU M60028]|uniref:M20 family metallopeptidase n=1 Tax=Alsobacter ponti TaxID=2962936 RepID=A0ABT1LC09_9HYPH|nr:M20 family metallopeptidase [Alsobacter ponti]MCP8938468.1 M20 family metallopeptidase [Alsobacter ponti]
MTREAAIRNAAAFLDSGGFAAWLARLVAIPSASREPTMRAALSDYLTAEMIPAFEAMGFTTRVLSNDIAPGPFLLAERIEDPGATTVLQYGHGDVVTGLDAQWSPGMSPWTLAERDGRWYGRGTADNKGQHAVNIAALRSVIETRGKLGFNCKFLLEMGEESGSLGLEEMCRDHKAALAADVFIASDGPRLALDRPTLFLGARGGLSFHLTRETREGFHHSGNWGGLLSNPGVELAHAIASLIGRHGEIRVPELMPAAIPANVRRALEDCAPEPTPEDPAIEPWWGEPGLSAAEKVFGWSSLEVMEMECGNLARPLYAIPPRATARMQLRFPVGVDPQAVVPAVRRHLDLHGFETIEVTPSTDAIFLASRLDPDHPWVARVKDSLARTLGRAPAVLPNLGGSLPNNIFCDLLGLPTIWIPHSYPGCRQHAADEHLPIAVAREGLEMMAGLYWDIGEPSPAPPA